MQYTATLGTDNRVFISSPTVTRRHIGRIVRQSDAKGYRLETCQGSLKHLTGSKAEILRTIAEILSY